MVAWCRLLNDKRLFALHRIQSQEISGEQFEARDRDEFGGVVPADLRIGIL